MGPLVNAGGLLVCVVSDLLAMGCNMSRILRWVASVLECWATHLECRQVGRVRVIDHPGESLEVIVPPGDVGELGQVPPSVWVDVLRATGPLSCDNRPADATLGLAYTTDGKAVWIVPN